MAGNDAFAVVATTAGLGVLGADAAAARSHAHGTGYVGDQSGLPAGAVIASGAMTIEDDIALLLGRADEVGVPLGHAIAVRACNRCLTL
jgi:hypothetical protein